MAFAARFSRMDEESLVRIAPDLLLAGWGRVAHSAEPLGGGMNSAAALVEPSAGPVVAKWVPKSSAAALAVGCEIAQQLASYGLVTGAPLPTTGGQPTYPTEEGSLALLRFVAGDPLIAASPRDQQDMAITLARVHAAETARRTGSFMTEQVAGLVHDVEPWVRPTVHLVLDEYGQLPKLTWGLLHGDPAPDAFIGQPETGVSH